MSKLLNFYFLRRAAVLPDLWSISKPLLLLVVVAVGYTLLGTNSFLIRAIAMTGMIGLLWVIVPDVKLAVTFAGRIIEKKVWKPT